ncbi:hypothetical protein GCM10027174_22160 [Salinifilum aidingensis]
MTSAGDGFRLSVSWLSVLPLGTDRVDARTTRQAISFAPVVGGLLGGITALALAVLGLLGAPGLLAGLLGVALLALLTRGMHLDGLADAVDGLGCYGPPERALDVMRDGSTGPFAVVALVLTAGIQAVSLAALAGAGQWLFIVVACAVGRAGFTLCCRRGVPAARQEGMGALVAGTQPNWAVAAWWVVLTGIGALGGSLSGALAVVLAGAALWAFAHHVRTRFGGITGDILGAASELGVTIALAVGSLPL